MILRWHLQIGNSVISRSSKPDHLASNIDIFDFELSQAEMDAIADLHTGARTGPDPDTFDGLG